MLPHDAHGKASVASHDMPIIDHLTFASKKPFLFIRIYTRNFNLKPMVAVFFLWLCLVKEFLLHQLKKQIKEKWPYNG